MNSSNINHRPIVIKAVLFVMAATVLLSCSSGSNDTSNDASNDADINMMMEQVSVTARYKVSFVTSWTRTTFPTNFPGGPHFSGLVGGTHNEQVRFWESGQLASDGIESMAETGSQTGLSAEVSAAIADGKAETVLSGPGNSAVGTAVLEFEISQNYPLVTLVSMVAPSPDWFVGVRDLMLFDNAAGDWKSSVEADLAVYDSGTDSGNVFSSANADVQAQNRGPVLLLSSNTADTDFIDGIGQGGEFIARMTFLRIK